MNSDKEIDHDEISSEDTLIFLASNLRKYPEIIDKSQLSDAKKIKASALQELIKLYGENFGKILTAQALLKKINNMKTRLKKKTDKKETGNRPIKLSGWEKILYEVLDGDSNPTVGKILGAISVGVSSDLQDVTNQQSKNRISTSPTPNSEFSIEPNQETQILARKRSLLSHKKRELNKHETEETKNLTTSELQRLVLIEQLHTARAQKDAAKAQEAFYRTKIQESTEKAEHGSEVFSLEF